MRQFIALAAIFTLFAQDKAVAQTPGPVPITWAELGEVVVGQKIRVEIPDRTRLEGQVLAVRPDTLVLDVRKTSNKSLHAKGQSEFPRAGIREITVLRERNAFFRVMGGVAGATAGFLGTSAVLYVTESALAVIPFIVLAIPLAAAGGYYLGKLADRTHTRLEIIP